MSNEHAPYAPNAVGTGHLGRLTLEDIQASIAPTPGQLVYVDGRVAWEPTPVREPYGRKWSRPRLVEEAKSLAAELGRSFSIHEFSAHLGTTHSTIYRHFPGGWAELIAAAGLQPRPKGMPTTWTEATLLAEYGRAFDHLGRHPSYVDLDRLTSASTSTYRRHFGPKQNLEAAFERYRSETDPT